MKKLKNISEQVYKLQGLYTWNPGETLEVDDDLAAHVLEAQEGRFEVVEDEPTTSNRKQSAGRFRRAAKK